MKTIHNLNDLQEFGINPLTGEACRVGRRILCDLTYEGEKIVADLLGLNYVTFNKYRTFPASWNSGSTGSFMLPYELITDLMVWCLIHEGCTQIAVVDSQTKGGLHYDGGVHGLREADDPMEWQEWLEHLARFGSTYRLITLKDQPGHGTRCTHQISGRTE
jgi:hypothetical protein